jgi:hypothetical protein
VLRFVQRVGRDLEAVGEEGEVADEDAIEARRLMSSRKPRGELGIDQRALGSLRLGLILGEDHPDELDHQPVTRSSRASVRRPTSAAIVSSCGVWVRLHIASRR